MLYSLLVYMLEAGTGYKNIMILMDSLTIKSNQINQKLVKIVIIITSPFSNFYIILIHIVIRILHFYF